MASLPAALWEYVAPQLPTTPGDVVFYAAAILGGGVALLLLAIGVALRELFKPLPLGGTPVTLPNGMRISHWQPLETDFLYGEIFGGSGGGAADAVYDSGSVTLGPGQTIVDAGANIGMFTLFCAMKARGDARILSFEPIFTTHAVLAANAATAVAGAYDAVFRPSKAARLSITALNVGLSDAPADVVFEHHPRMSIWSTGDAAFAEDRRQRFIVDIVRAFAHSDSSLARALPSWFVRAVVRLAISRMAASVKVPARLERLSDVLGE